MRPEIFCTESDLVGALFPHLPHLLFDCEGEGQLLSEVQVGPTIPDILMVRHLRNHGHSLQLSGLESHLLLQLLISQSLSESQLSRRLFTRRKRIASTLQALLRQGLVREKGDGRAYLANGCLPWRAEIIAIEAKLNRWRQAISQASRYRAFADAAYVALPANLTAARPDLRGACSEAQVGLIAVDGHQARVLLRSRKRAPKSAERIRLLAQTALAPS